jgi:ribonucleotide reductase alpha subunit
MKIYKTISNNIYLNDSINVTIETDIDGKFELLKITSIYISNPNEYSADNPLYVQDIKNNKKEVKKELKEIDLWEKGIIKAIEFLFNEVVIE